MALICPLLTHPYRERQMGLLTLMCLQSIRGRLASWLGLQCP